MGTGERSSIPTVVFSVRPVAETDECPHLAAAERKAIAVPDRTCFEFLEHSRPKFSYTVFGKRLKLGLYRVCVHELPSAARRLLIVVAHRRHGSARAHRRP